MSVPSLLLFANNATTTLAGAVSSGATSMNVAAGTGHLFPNPAAGQYFVVRMIDQATGLLDEIVYVTARSTDTFTSVVRGQEGTTPLAWLAGDSVNNFGTAGSAAAMVQVAQLQQQAGNWVVATGAANAYTLTLTPTPASLAFLVGVPLRFQTANTNTGASTLTVTGAGTASIVNPYGTALTAGQIAANEPNEVIYNGGAFFLMAPRTYLSLLGQQNTWTAQQNFSAGVDVGGTDAGSLQFRMYSGAYGSGWRQDGSNTYLLITPSGNPLGTFGPLRPFYVNNASGAVTLDATGAGVNI